MNARRAVEGGMIVGGVATETLNVIARLAGGAVAVAVVAGYLALGATVLVGRSVLDIVQRTGGLLRPGSARRDSAGDESRRAA
jgi:hypothetical protein